MERSLPRDRFTRITVRDDNRSFPVHGSRFTYHGLSNRDEGDRKYNFRFPLDSLEALSFVEGQIPDSRYSAGAMLRFFFIAKAVRAVEHEVHKVAQRGKSKELNIWSLDGKSLFEV
jgi:hypothetical protein